ncbi:MAG: hypothetical protein HYZ25_06670 [Chloroflexi bacterium]|nr:hypothetical protein [Chloroflexota bacterium]
METKAIIALALMILGIVVINFALYAAARGMSDWFSSMGKGMQTPLTKDRAPYDELRQKMRELSDEKKED